MPWRCAGRPAAGADRVVPAPAGVAVRARPILPTPISATVSVMVDSSPLALCAAARRAAFADTIGVGSAVAIGPRAGSRPDFARLIAVAEEELPGGDGRPCLFSDATPDNNHNPNPATIFEHNTIANINPDYVYTPFNQNVKCSVVNFFVPEDGSNPNYGDGAYMGYNVVSDVPQLWQKVLLTSSEERKSAGSPSMKANLL